MSTAPTGWAPLILTTLGGGAVGSLITTYGAQTRERRQARAAAREALRDIEDFSPSHRTNPDTIAALKRLETRAMLAGLPRKLTELHQSARLRSDAAHTNPETNKTSLELASSLALERVAQEAAQLLAAATWHRYRGIFYRWYRIRHLTRLLDAADPAMTYTEERTRRALYKWERDTIKEAKRIRKTP